VDSKLLLLALLASLTIIAPKVLSTLSNAFMELTLLLKLLVLPVPQVNIAGLILVALMMVKLEIVITLRVIFVELELTLLSPLSLVLNSFNLDLDNSKPTTVLSFLVSTLKHLVLLLVALLELSSLVTILALA
jgi:hypothetical protein